MVRSPNIEIFHEVYPFLSTMSNYLLGENIPYKTN